MNRLVISACFILLFSACSKNEEEKVKETEAAKAEEKLVPVADAAYVNGRIYTVDKDNSWARAVAVSKGEIIAVGTNAEIARHVSATTQVYNLKNKMLMPGIHDMHAHPMQAGEKYNFQCAFPSPIVWMRL